MHNCLDTTRIIYMALNALMCVALLPLSIYHNIQWEYESFDAFTKYSFPAPLITYFRVYDGNGSVTKKHSFFYWEGMLGGDKGFNLTFWRNTTFILKTLPNIIILLYWNMQSLKIYNVMKDINNVAYLIHLIKHYVY